MRRKKIRLVEVELYAAVERRPAGVRSGLTRAAEEVHVTVLRVHASLLFGPVPDAEVHALMLAFGDGDTDRRLGWLQFRIDRFDVGELEQLQAVEAPLRVLESAATVHVAGLEGELTLDDAIADRLVALNFNGADMHEAPRRRGERHGGHLF